MLSSILFQVMKHVLMPLILVSVNYNNPDTVKLCNIFVSLKYFSFLLIFWIRIYFYIFCLHFNLT